MSIRSAVPDKARIRLWRTLLSAMLVLLSHGNSIAAEISEAAVKAVYIFNFASFVEWPEDENAPVPPTFDICTLGEDEVSTLLPGVIKDEKLGQTPLRHLALSSSDTLQSCRILYLSTVDDETMSNVRNAVNGRPILTVSDQAGFAVRGGHIEFGLLRKRVHTIINRRSVNTSGLRVSAQLYRLATVVD